MTASLRNPLFPAVLALVGGLVAGPFWYWHEGGRMVAAAQARRHAVVVQQEERTKSWDFWTIAIDNLTAELKGDKERLRQRSDELDQRQARLDAEMQAVQQSRLDLQAMRDQIDAKVISINADEAKNLRSLAQTYTNLTAPAAVAILRHLDDTTAVKILSLMKPDAVGQIFEEMAHPSGGGDDQSLRAAVLSDKIRLMKSSPPANATATD